MSPTTSKPATSKPAIPGYGRARLWLGITGVGTVVTLSALTLAWGKLYGYREGADMGFGSQVARLSWFFGIYALVQLPFDFLGGYWLPKRFGRAFPNLLMFVGGLFRGVVVHGSLLLLAAIIIMVAGRYGGVAGSVIAGLAISFLLLSLRVPIAFMMSPMGLIADSSTSVGRDAILKAFDVKVSDEGFTGGVVGVIRPRWQLLPIRWRAVLGSEGFELAVARRNIAVKTGSWYRGRAISLLFTTIGFLGASLLVGSKDLGTAWGTIQYSLWFSLWSFLGLLTLPTLSRRGVMEIDQKLQSEGYSVESIRANTELLDRLQDGEPTRPSLVETIFHPVPSVENRLGLAGSPNAVGYWDVARTSIYLSIAGIGLLGRAVHCNCGRPALWVFLPTE